MKTFVIVTALVVYEDKLLILKRADSKKFAPGQWEFISGFVDAKDSVENILHTEFEEELGMQATIDKKGDVFTFEDEEGSWIVIPYLVKLNSQVININADDHSEYKWIHISELSNYEELDVFKPMLKLLN